MSDERLSQAMSEVSSFFSLQIDELMQKTVRKHHEQFDDVEMANIICAGLGMSVTQFFVSATPKENWQQGCEHFMENVQRALEAIARQTPSPSSGIILN